MTASKTSAENAGPAADLSTVDNGDEAALHTYARAHYWRTRLPNETVAAWRERLRKEAAARR